MLHPPEADLAFQALERLKEKAEKLVQMLQAAAAPGVGPGAFGDALKLVQLPAEKAPLHPEVLKKLQPGDVCDVLVLDVAPVLPKLALAVAEVEGALLVLQKMAAFSKAEG